MSARAWFPLRDSMVIVLLSAGLLCPAAPAVSAAPEPNATGLIVSLSGSVVIHGAGGARDAMEGSILQDGETVVVKTGGTCRGFTPLGEPFSLSGPAELVLASAEGQTGLGAAYTWIRRQITQWIGENRSRPLTTRSARDWEYAAQVPAPIVPAPGGSVRSSRARFRWTTLEGVDSYDLTIASEAGDESGRTARGCSTVLDGLSPGAAYLWKVRPAVEGWAGDSSWREFRVLTHDEERELEGALDGLGDLEAGVLLLSAGLHEEAVHRFDAAVSAGDVARSARLWRAKAFADLGLYRDAYEDLRLSQEGVSW